MVKYIFVAGNSNKKKLYRGLSPAIDDKVFSVISILLFCHLHFI